METEIIRSIDNPQFKSLRKLANSSRERRKKNQTLLDGVHLIQALAEHGLSPELLVIRDDSQDIDEIEQILAKFIGIRHLYFSHGLFDEISPVQSPLGILALINIPVINRSHFQSAVLLEEIQDPGNLGSIIRTTAAAGFDAVFLSGGCAEAWSPKALRAGMGAQFDLAIYENADLQQTASQFDTVIATELNGEDSLYDLRMKDSIAFIFGNEGAGLPESLLACATHRVSIPMPGGVESLNVGAAVAICLFEKVRQNTCLTRSE